MRLKKRYVVLAALAGAIAALSTVAFASSAHFIGTPTCSKSNSGVLTCSGKAAGLGNGPTVAFLSADSINATYVCRNHGGNIAPGQGTFTGPVEGQEQAITPRDGQITFSPESGATRKSDSCRGGLPQRQVDCRAHGPELHERGSPHSAARGHRRSDLLLRESRSLIERLKV